MSDQISVSGHPIGKRLGQYSDESITSHMTPDQLAARAAFTSRVSQQIWSLSDRPCQLCGDREFRLVALTDRHGLPVRTLLCTNCALVQTSPVLGREDYKDYYATVYRRLYDPAGRPTDEFFDDQRRRGRALASQLLRGGVRPPATVVEVGVGAGGVLQGFLDNGFVGSGCDYGEDFLTYGCDRGLDLRLGGIETFASQTADVVVYSHVLEHVYDLRHELEQIRRVLRPGGHLVVEVPGLFAVHRTYGADLRDYLQSAHLYYFSRRTLRHFLCLSGFTERRSNYLIQGVFRAETGGSRPTTKPPPLRASVVPTLLYLRMCVLVRPFIARVHRWLTSAVRSRRSRPTQEKET